MFQVGKNNEPWALAFYDWVVQNEDDIWNKLKQAEPNETGNLGRMEFCDAILGMGAPVSEDCLKKVLVLFTFAYWLRMSTISCCHSLRCFRIIDVHIVWCNLFC